MSDKRDNHEDEFVFGCMQLQGAKGWHPQHLSGDPDIQSDRVDFCKMRVMEISNYCDDDDDDDDDVDDKDHDQMSATQIRALKMGQTLSTVQELPAMRLTFE